MAKLTLDEEIQKTQNDLLAAQQVYATTGRFRDSLPIAYNKSKLDTLLQEKLYQRQNFGRTIQQAAINQQQNAANQFYNQRLGTLGAQNYATSSWNPYGQGFQTVSSVMPIQQFNQMWGQAIPTSPNDNAATLQPTWEELLEVKVINFGKHAGQAISQIPEDYINWLIDTHKKDIKEYEAELERRKLVETANVSVTEAIIQAGYREMAKRLHPDKGGDPLKFQELTAANEQLKMVLMELKNVKGTNA